MSRLTVRTGNLYDLIGEYKTNATEFEMNEDVILNKLGHLEDLEDELGCPLEEIVEFIKLLKKVYYINITGRLDERWSPYKSNEKELCKINSIFYKIKDKSE